MARLARLDILIDSYNTETELRIAGISGLKRLKIDSSEERQHRPLGHQVSEVVAKSPKLTSLHLLGDGAYSAIWPILGSRACRGVRLRRLSTNTVTKELLTYLESYSGLQTLALVGVDAGTREASDELAETFFGGLLARHSDTLYDLAFTAGYENNWSFGGRSVDSLLGLHKLETLRVSVNKEDVFEAPDLRSVKTKGNVIVRSILHCSYHFSPRRLLINSICYSTCSSTTSSTFRPWKVSLSVTPPPSTIAMIRGAGTP
jgi:hypothetical protein